MPGNSVFYGEEYVSPPHLSLWNSLEQNCHVLGINPSPQNPYNGRILPRGATFEPWTSSGSLDAGRQAGGPFHKPPQNYPELSSGRPKTCTRTTDPHWAEQALLPTTELVDPIESLETPSTVVSNTSSLCQAYLLQPFASHLWGSPPPSPQLPWPESPGLFWKPFQGQGPGALGCKMLFAAEPLRTAQRQETA